MSFPTRKSSRYQKHATMFNWSPCTRKSSNQQRWRHTNMTGYSDMNYMVTSFFLPPDVYVYTKWLVTLLGPLWTLPIKILQKICHLNGLCWLKSVFWTVCSEIVSQVKAKYWYPSFLVVVFFLYVHCKVFYRVSHWKVSVRGISLHVT